MTVIQIGKIIVRCVDGGECVGSVGLGYPDEVPDGFLEAIRVDGFVGDYGEELPSPKRGRVGVGGTVVGGEVDLSPAPQRAWGGPMMLFPRMNVVKLIWNSVVSRDVMVM
jgi:hypothetical protein